MYEYHHLTLHKDNNSIVWMALDVQNKPANILTPDVLQEIQIACSEIKHLGAKGMVLCSNKTNGFIAGADIELFKGDSDAENSIDSAMAYITLGQRTCDAIENIEIPTVALIDGFCMGGGTEVSLACDYIIVSDNPATKVSLPEIKLGIHPGFGGTVRSIKRMGVMQAMPMMLTGRNIKARSAVKIGLADYCVPLRQLRNTAIQILLNPPAKHRVPTHQRLLEKQPMRSWIANKMRKQVAEKASPEHYPAPYALINLWEKYGDDLDNMYPHEARSVSRLILTETAQNLVRVFFLQTQLKNLGNKSLFTPKHVHVIGGGVMGGDIATWCAAQGLTVTIQDMNHEALAQVIKRANKSLLKKFKKDRLSIRNSLDRITPDIEGNGIAQADVIIEAIFENLEAKQQVFKEVESRAKPEAVFATNTSSIPLAEIAQVLEQPSRLVGLHFFNPVFQMPLLEIVFDHEGTDQNQVALASSFARHINKLPLPVKSSPGFLVNRILMPYLLEAFTLYQQGIPAPVIDKAARDFGMPMGPLELADTVGLDICLHVGKIISEAMDIELPDNLQRIVDDKNLGKKTGQGFYTYKNGKPVKTSHKKWSGDTKHIQERLIEKILQESQECLNENVIGDADLLDAGVIFGTGFAPFRGGPMHYSKSQNN